MNQLQIIKETPTKANMESFVNAYLSENHLSPLEKYLNLKAIEYMLKLALENKEFRENVKADYLETTDGALSKVEVMGVEIKTRSMVKQNVLSKTYIYSEKVDKLEREIELLEQELKMKRDNLKGQKLLEVNTGEAKLLGEAKPENVLDEFNLQIYFKNN